MSLAQRNTDMHDTRRKGAATQESLSNGTDVTPAYAGESNLLPNTAPGQTHIEGYLAKPPGTQMATLAKKGVETKVVRSGI